MDIFLSLLDYCHQTWAEILIIGNDRCYWFYREATSCNASFTYSKMTLFLCQVLLLLFRKFKVT